MDTLKRHLPFSGEEGLQELKKIVVRFEEKIYTAATDQVLANAMSFFLYYLEMNTHIKTCVALCMYKCVMYCIHTSSLVILRMQG